MDDQLSGFSRTAWDEVPDSGTASFSGYATLVVDTAPAVSLLIGNANININFDNPGVIGSLTNFVGSDSSGNLEEYDGTIAVTSGTLARFRDNDFYAIYGGSLAAPGDSIIISGELEGEFVRTPLQGIQAKDTGVVASHNGTSTLADLKVVGQLK